MPLIELSPNVRRHVGHSQSSRSLDKGLHPPTNPASALAPDAVQSMLKTTTEMGDIGQFSVRPSLPRSGSRMLALRRRSGSFDSTFIPALSRHRSRPLRSSAQTHHGPRQVPSSATLSRQDTIRSSLTSYRNNPRARQRNVRPYPSRIEGAASPRVGPPSLYTHRSLVTLRSRKDFPSMRSVSPVGHTRRLCKPSYRATSPAYSDALPQNYNFQLDYHRSESVGTPGSSPVSAFPRFAGVPGYFPPVNSSMASFVRFPSPAVQPRHYRPRRSPFPSRTNTPASGSIREMQRSPTGSTIPQYYDYTEAFAEEGCFSSDIGASANSLPFNMDQTILENEPPSHPRRAQTPFGTMPGSAFYPAELPTKHNRTTSEQSKYSAGANFLNRKSSQDFSRRSKTPHAADQKVSERSLDLTLSGITLFHRCSMSKHSRQQRLQCQRKVTPVSPLRLRAEQVRPLLPVHSSQMRVEARVIWRVSPPGYILLYRVIIATTS
jgi:hypothetical protein